MTHNFNAMYVILKQWAGLQGQDLCWHHDEVLRSLCAIVDIEVPPPVLPPRCEFEQGCVNYQAKLYGTHWDAVRRQLENELQHCHSPLAIGMLEDRYHELCLSAAEKSIVTSLCSQRQGQVRNGS